MDDTLIVKKSVKKALKVLKFWQKVLLSTDLMNDVNDRNEFQNALKTLKDYSQKE
ncbi:hypothetical protein [Flavobacterium sp. HNIBRBA15423]|uniref:hypothetical protein n=1 Tax=Flavobacterium sp. HNIBRBA15423 TaxID=3458683 RepID=UPI004044A0D9